MLPDLLSVILNSISGIRIRQSENKSMFDITISIWTLVLLSSLTGLGFGLYIKTRQKLDEANEILWANNLPQVI